MEVVTMAGVAVLGAAALGWLYFSAKLRTLGMRTEAPAGVCGPATRGSAFPNTHRPKEATDG